MRTGSGYSNFDNILWLQWPKVGLHCSSWLSIDVWITWIIYLASQSVSQSVSPSQPASQPVSQSVSQQVSRSVRAVVLKLFCLQELQTPCTMQVAAYKFHYYYNN